MKTLKKISLGLTLITGLFASTASIAADKRITLKVPYRLENPQTVFTKGEAALTCDISSMINGSKQVLASSLKHINISHPDSNGVVTDTIAIQIDIPQEMLPKINQDAIYNCSLDASTQPAGSGGISKNPPVNINSNYFITGKLLN